MCYNENRIKSLHAIFIKRGKDICRTEKKNRRRNRLASNSLLESLVFARKAADDMIFGQTPEYVRADAIDMNMYESREELLNACHETVLKEIERMKKSHE